MVTSVSALTNSKMFIPVYTQNQNPKYYKSLGDSYMDRNKYREAVNCYKKALELAPNENELLLNLARAYRCEKDYDDSVNSLNKYIASASSTCEVQTMKGETYLEEGNFEAALECFKKAMEADSQDDNAKRGYLEVKNRILEQTEPERAKQERYEQGVKTLNEALSITTQYLSPSYMKNLNSLRVVFDKTASMSGTPNIAQYEHGKKRIVVTDKYTYAAPEIISAYLVHECVHAKDKDAYTSIAEEQDAYREAAKFWILNSHGIKDSEMDYAAELYKKSPAALDARVAEIYRLRDPDIADTSPYHSGGIKFSASSKIQSTAANTGLKKYDFIA